MYQPVVLYIGLRYMYGWPLNCLNRLISWFSTITIMLGVTAMVTVLSVMNGFERELESKILELIPQVLLTTQEEQLNPKEIPASMLAKLKGVTRVAPLTTSNVMLQSTHNVSMGVMLGINPGDSEPLSNYFLEASQNDLQAGQYRIILGNILSTELNVKRGDTLRLIIPGSSQLTPIGHIPNQRLFTVAGVFSAKSEVDSYLLLINQQDASHLMHYPAGYITGWRLWLKQPLEINHLITQSIPKSLVWKDWREQKGELFQAVRMEKNIMCLLLSLIIIAATFNIITSLALLVMEKKSEIAVLQTQGLTRKKIMLVFIIHGSSMGIIGTLLGVVFGIFFTNELNHLMPFIGMLFDRELLPVAIKPLQVISIAMSSIAITLLSTIYPSWHAAAIHPAEALRHE